MGQRAPHLQDTLMLHFRLFVATYSSVLAVHCFDESTIDWFLQRHYREAYEDMPMDGNYDYLFVGESPCGRTTLYQDFVSSGSTNAPTIIVFLALAVVPILVRKPSQASRAVVL